MIKNPHGFAIAKDSAHISESASFPWFSVQLILFIVKSPSLRNAVDGLVELHMSLL